MRSQIAPSPELAPRYLLQLPEKEKLALVLDSTKSTLFVFENTGKTPRYVADYYVTIGKNGLEKLREGDKKTPVGVYHVVSRLPKDKLTDFYGSGAYPISYPNEWDQMRGRDGHGIWLHGTPRDTYSRPPRASDGCIVLTNQDLESLAARLQIGSTPIVIADSMDWAKPDEVESLRSDLASSIESWRHDWESRNTDAYLRHYARKFTSNGLNLAQWSAQKHQVNAGKDLDQGQGLRHVAAALPRQGGNRRSDIRAGLRQQQPVQSHDEAPVLDQGKQQMAHRVRGRGVTAGLMPPTRGPGFARSTEC